MTNALPQGWYKHVGQFSNHFFFLRTWHKAPFAHQLFGPSKNYSCQFSPCLTIKLLRLIHHVKNLNWQMILKYGLLIYSKIFHTILPIIFWGSKWIDPKSQGPNNAFCLQTFKGMYNRTAGGMKREKTEEQQKGIQGTINC